VIVMETKDILAWIFLIIGLGLGLLLVLSIIGVV
jgi:hypothetical protein